ALENTYCQKIGFEYMTVADPELKAWVQEKIEPHFSMDLSREEKLQILLQLNKAELFETFLHTKYVGQTRFSLEGGETFIPILAAILDEGSEAGVKEAILGMAHRGRLNVLANLLNKSYASIFNEFEDHYTPDLTEGTGDVKYHKGLTGDYRTSHGRTVSVILPANPSHLESVDPIIEGQTRAKQEQSSGADKREGILPIIIHGDAALAGQGVVYETMQLSRLTGYSTGGTVHVVINNQIGFTTSPKDSRSTLYCTDLAKTFGSPVFHVNAEDPQGCVAVARLALELRQRFHCDVFIDLNCYRKYGHNEGDEPNFTQPLEYQRIRQKQTIRHLFEQQLIQEGVLTEADAKKFEEDFRASLQSALESIQAPSPIKAPPLPQEKKNVAPLQVKVETRLPKETLIELAEKICSIPEGFELNSKVKRLLQERLSMVKGDPQKPTIDWGMAEALGLASVLTQGIHIRLSGQDSRRGTFSHRHAIIVDQNDEKKYFPLSHLSPSQAPFDVFNSPLSEYAVLGFEFGYSLFYPKSLVIWEAQYGDFVNGAQIILDQYIASSEQKWGDSSNLTLLLPHGYEGGGPEHSSARIERFLQLAAEDNMRVVSCTTPKQLFHVLRRQALSLIKKPLILFSPKALLRHPLCLSSLNDCASVEFEEFLDDPQRPSKVDTLLLCSGKIFYDLLTERQKREAARTAILRIEQLYPLDVAKLAEHLISYGAFEECVWVQEEHSNMGPWETLRPLLETALKGRAPLRYAGRSRSASPAAGSYFLHKKQHLALMDEVFKTSK
ncbi:MAG: 2-oxoglutarate dehydrogenase E1 component, partial [Anaerolineae bacterium]